MAVLVLEILAMAALYVILMSLTQGLPGAPFYISLLMLVVELSLLVAWAILFSTYSAPTTATLFSLAVFFIGNLADDILRFGQNSESAWINEGSQWLYWILPNFELLNGSQAAVHYQMPSAAQVMGSLAYGLGYTIAVLSVAILVFSKRDFK
jgi:ABC-type transport system involved in multi-copper enzyme maturation permease subunit